VLSPFSVRALTTQSGRGILPAKAFQDGHSYVLRLWPLLSTRLQLELFFGFSEFVEGRNHPSLCTCFWGESLGRTLISTRRRHPPPASICSWPSCCYSPLPLSTRRVAATCSNHQRQVRDHGGLHDCRFLQAKLTNSLPCSSSCSMALTRLKFATRVLYNRITIGCCVPLPPPWT
jgi:hypothetical protein